MGSHKVTRESDESVCSCGLRWGVRGEDPHPSVAKQSIAEIRDMLSNIPVSKVSKWHVVPYNFLGVKLYSVEDTGGYVEKYCDTLIDAQEYCDRYNNVSA